MAEARTITSRPTREVLSRLYEVANDEEAAVLGALAVRAGPLWQCAAPLGQDLRPCSYYNAAEAVTCDGCGNARPDGTGPETKS